MAKNTAKIFMHGRSQAVRLPKEFRLPGKECRVRREGKAVILEPIDTTLDLDAFWARIDELRGDHDFLPEGIPEPEAPLDEVVWDADVEAPEGQNKR